MNNSDKLETDDTVISNVDFRQEEVEESAHVDDGDNIDPTDTKQLDFDEATDGSSDD